MLVLVTKDLLPPHRDGDGGFRNPWPGGAPQPITGLFRWWWRRRTNGVPPDPDPSVFPLVSPAFRAPRAADGALTATWIGHAAVLLQLGDANVLTDPMFGERAFPVGFAGPRRWVAPGIGLDALPPIDAVVLSHNHYDHLHLGSVRALVTRWPDARWFVPLGLERTVRRAGAHFVCELDWWETASVNDLTITATPAQHFSARGITDRNRSLWCGFALSTGRRRVFFAGDTGYHPEFRRIAERCGPFHLALLPIGAYEPRWFMRPVHMNPEEAVRAFTDLNTGPEGVMGAIHWGTFKLTDEPMDEPPRRTRAAWAAAGLPERRLWVPRHGETLELSSGRSRM